MAKTKLKVELPTGELAHISEGLSGLNDDLYFREANTSQIFVLSLDSLLDNSDDRPKLRPAKLLERGWSRDLSFQQSGLTPAGTSNQIFALVGDPPCLIVSGSYEELEVHTLSMGSRAKIKVNMEKISCLAHIELPFNSWCLVLMNTSGRSVLIRGKEDDEKETLKVDKTVFDTGLGAWESDEEVVEGETIHFDAMCLEKTQRRLILASRKVALHHQTIRNSDSEIDEVVGLRLLIFELIVQEDQSLDLVMIERTDLPLCKDHQDSISSSSRSNQSFERRYSVEQWNYSRERLL